jgi:TldD protein
MDSLAKSYQISKRGVIVSDNRIWCKRGFVVRVWKDGGYFEYSFNEISDELLPGIVKTIDEDLLGMDASFVGADPSDFPQPDEVETSFERSTSYEISPEDIGDEAIIERLRQCRQSGLDSSAVLLDCMVSVNFQRFSKMYISYKKHLTQNIMWTAGAVSCLAKSGEEVKDSYVPFSVLGGMELLDKMQTAAPEVARGVLELLHSEPIVPGTYDCVCTPEVTGMIVHEAFGHGVEMDMFVKNRAQAKDFIGKRVASDLVNMHDTASSAFNAGTYFFDDEGVEATDTLVIEKGILKQGMSDLLSANTLGTQPTGNGRRESYARKAYTRMTNTYFEGGSDTYEDMIASIENGFLLSCPTSGMEDPKNWGIQCMVNTAHEIVDGKLTGKVFSPIVLTGYVPDLLKSISMVSADTELSGSGVCGKGYKELIKVSDGGPYIKAKIRLG